MMPLNHILRKCTAGCNLSKLQENIKHSMYVDDIKLFCQKRIGNPNTNSDNIQSSYWNGIRQRKMHHVSYEKSQTTHDRRRRTTKSSSHQNTRRKGSLHILGDIGSWQHKTIGYERKKLKSVSQKSQNITREKLDSKNIVKMTITWVFSLVRYLGPFLKWTREKLKQMDQRKRKPITMHKVLHSRDDIDSLYLSRRESRRWLASIEDSVVDTSI